MAGIVRTIIGNAVVRLSQQFFLLAGVDGSNNPRLAKVDAGGALLVSGVLGGMVLPSYDESVLANYPGTNNLHTVTLKSAGTVVGTITLTYAGGGAADNDVLTGTKLT